MLFRSLMPFYSRRSELSVQGDCVLWGLRVVVPTLGRSPLLKVLHSEHTGTVRMKQLARGYFWWPLLDKDIENVASSCSVCIQNRSSPPKAPLDPWEWPTIPWYRVHIDYVGPIYGYYFLIIVDSTSKWLEVIKTKSITAEVTISLL